MVCCDSPSKLTFVVHLAFSSEFTAVTVYIRMGVNRQREKERERGRQRDWTAFNISV